MKRVTALLLLPACLLVGVALAGETPGAHWYRYYDDRHQPTITDSITPEHVARGYDVLGANMQVLEHVAPQRAMTPEEKAAIRAKAEQARQDKQLLRLYSLPSDAERERDHQIDSLQMRIDFSTNSLNGLRQRRAAEAQKAAAFERTGRPEPKELKDSISDYDRQIQSAQDEIKQRRAEQDKVRAEFEPVIQRLRELLDPKPATPTPAPPG